MNTTSVVRLYQLKSLPGWLTAEQRVLLEELLKAYRAFRGSKRHKLRTIEADEATLLDFFTHARGIPGQAQPEHFERWANHLYLERKVAASTQRGYQNTVRLFFDYVLGQPRLRNAIRRAMGQEAVQVATPENCIVHRRERELEADSARRSFTDLECAAFFERIDLEIALAYTQCSKALRSLQRDKALFSAVLELGLRASEATGLNIDSFEPNHDHPSMGAFGVARVYGKGSKWRRVPALKPALSRVLQWYVEHVRPSYLAGAVPGEKALFLSERGARLSYSAFYQQFTRIKELAGLPTELVPHCLRHTSVSNDDMGGLSLEANRLRHGHTYGSTLQGYMHHPDTYVREEFGRAIKKNLQDNPPRHDKS